MRKDGTIESFVEYAQAREDGLDILWYRNETKVDVCHSESAIRQAIRDKSLIVKQEPETIVIMVDWDNEDTRKKNDYYEVRDWGGYEEFTIVKDTGRKI